MTNKIATFMEEVLYEAMEDPYVGNSVDEVVMRVAKEFNLAPSEYLQLHHKIQQMNPLFLNEIRNR